MSLLIKYQKPISFYFCSLERVTEGFLKVLDDQDNNGKSLIVTANVMNYATFPDPFQPATK